MRPQVCIANIGTAERRRRRRGGAIALALGGAVLLGGPVAGAPTTLVFLAGTGLLLGGFVGVFQARGKT